MSIRIALAGDTMGGPRRRSRAGTETGAIVLLSGPHRPRPGRGSVHPESGMLHFRPGSANFTAKPLPRIRAAAQALRGRATLIAGHSAHVFHGVEGNVVYDMGDFLQTYSGERGSDSLLRRAIRRGLAELSQTGSELGSKLRGRPIAGPAGSDRKESFIRRKLRRAHLLLLELRAARLRDDLGCAPQACP